LLLPCRETGYEPFKRERESERVRERESEIERDTGYEPFKRQTGHEP